MSVTPWDSAAPHVIPVLCGVPRGGRGIPSSVLNPLVPLRSSGRASAKCNSVFSGVDFVVTRSQKERRVLGRTKIGQPKNDGAR